MHQELIVAVTKLRELDNELATRQGVTIVALSVRLGLCERTIRRYIVMLRELGCEIINAEESHQAPARWRHLEKSGRLFIPRGA